MSTPQRLSRDIKFGSLFHVIEPESNLCGKLRTQTHLPINITNELLFLYW